MPNVEGIVPNNHRNIIEINGKKYDAKTGRIVNETMQSSQPGSGVVMDGVMPKQPQVITPVQHSLKPKPALRRTNATPAKRRTPQKSQILARKAVTKPQSKQSNTANIQLQHPHKAKPQRHHNSVNIQKSPYIKRFGSTAAVQKTTTELAVHKPNSLTPKLKETSLQPTTSLASPKKHHSQQKSQTEEMLSQALSNLGVSPKQKPVKAKKSRARRSFQWASGLAAAILLVGFIAYMNYPNINLKYATSRAGITANMPNYNPDGYSFAGPIQYAPGKVTIRFASNTDNRNYSVSQEVSNWNSETLQESFLSDQNKTFSTAQASGRTIYLYDNTNATWVNGGVWYQVNSDSLSPEQLINIASSL